MAMPLTGTISGTGYSAARWTPAMLVPFTLELSGEGVVRVERARDGSVTSPDWHVVGLDGAGTPAIYSIPSYGLVLVFEEPERQMDWVLNCTTFTSTITFRWSAN